MALQNYVDKVGPVVSAAWLNFVDVLLQLNLPTYGTTVTVDAAQANYFRLTVTDGVAFTIAAPANPSTGTPQKITLMIRNTSGGALGAITWNAVFKMVAWTSPANGFSRSISFVYDGTNWVETFRSAADVPN
jgi:hypothetical protein